MAFPVDEKYVVETEAKLGVKFPASYRKRMIEENGGEVRTGTDGWVLHPFFDQSDRKRITRTANHIVRETDVAKGWAGFPQNAVVIGSNGSGDRLVFIRKESDQPSLGPTVFWWDHETRKLHVVAKDFGELAAG